MIRLFELIITGKIRNFDDLKKRLIKEIKSLPMIFAGICIVMILLSISTKESSKDISIVDKSETVELSSEDIDNTALTLPNWALGTWYDDADNQVIIDNEKFNSYLYNVSSKSDESYNIDVYKDGGIIDTYKITGTQSGIMLYYFNEEDNTFTSGQSLTFEPKKEINNTQENQLQELTETELQSNDEYYIGEISDIYGTWIESVNEYEMIITDSVFDSRDYSVKDIPMANAYILSVYEDGWEDEVHVEYQDGYLNVSYYDYETDSFYGHRCYYRKN